MEHKRVDLGVARVELDDTGNGWWTLTVDTPWGPLAFAAQGPTKSELVACAPPGSVPPVAPPPPGIAFTPGRGGRFLYSEPARNRPLAKNPPPITWHE